jgi:prolipoprotein diacylglyceryltransferase
MSLTVESLGKVLIGVIGYFLVSKGMDAATAQTQLQAIVDLTAQAIPLAFTLWNSGLAIWGAVRKLLVAVTKQPTPVPAQQ